MIRAFVAGFGIAVAALFVLLFVSVPGWTAGLHPRCGIDWPCAANHVVGVTKMVRADRREARRLARGARLERSMPFGAAIVPPETARSFLGKSSGLVAPLAAKLASIQSACPGTVAISGVRHTYVRGTGRISLHASGKAVDVRGPYGCIYGQLQGWQGGYSTDAGRVRHIHISIGGREDGIRFVHGGGRKHARRTHRHSYAEAGR